MMAWKSSRAELAWHRLEIMRLLRLQCAGCGHDLSAHSDMTDNCSGEIGGKVCRCSRWAEPENQMALNG